MFVVNGLTVVNGGGSLVVLSREMRRILRISFAAVCMGVLTLYFFDGIVFSSQGEALSYEEFKSDKGRLAKIREQMADMGVNEADLPNIYQEYLAQQAMVHSALSASKKQPGVVFPFKAKMGKIYGVLARLGKGASFVTQKFGWCPRDEQVGMLIGFSLLLLGIAGLSQLASILERKARS